MTRLLFLLSFLFVPSWSFFSSSVRPLVKQPIRAPVVPPRECCAGNGRIVSSLFDSIGGNQPRRKKSKKPKSNDNVGEFIARNKRIVALGRARQWRDILELAEKEKDQFNNINWATSFSQLGRIRNLNCRDPLFASFVSHYANLLREKGIEWAGIRQVANVEYTIGKMKLKTRPATRIVEFVARKENACKIVEKGDTQHVANICWSLGKLNNFNAASSFFGEVEKRTAWLVENGETQHIANTAWAFATLGVKSKKLFDEIDERAAWLVQNGKPQEISNTAWAFATLGLTSPNLFDSIDKRAAWLVQNGKTQEIANTAWAFATVGTTSPNLFAEIDKNAVWLVQNGNTQDIANTAWAVATLGTTSPNLFAEIDKNAAWLVQNGETQHIANTAWAVATLGTFSPNLFAEIDKNAAWLLQNGNTQEIANTAWAVATLGTFSPNLFAEIDKNAAWLVQKGNTQEIANTALAFANNGHSTYAFFTAIANNTSKLISCGNPQEIINVCYSISILNMEKAHSEALHQLWNCAINLDPTMLATEELRQLAQVFAYSKANGVNLEQPSAALTKNVRNAVPTNVQSKFQKEVAQSLEKIGLDFEEEVSPLKESDLDNGMLCIDLACESQMLAIECDGISHFLKLLPTGNIGRQENGATKAKRRFLRQMGWAVVNIDYRDWMEAKQMDRKALFLCEKLNQAGIELA